ncbi:MAG: hypothetical protein WCL04_07425 [Verrucomicrobiota bacterium]
MPTLTFKVTAAEAATIRARARAAKGTVSTYLRKHALPAPAKRAPVKLVFKKHPISGASYIASPVGPKVTAEEIKEALADFP